MSESQYSSLMAQATIFMADGLHRDALSCLNDAVEVARRNYHKRDKRLAAALEARSKVNKDLGNGLEAEQDMHEAVSIRLSLMGKRAASLSTQHKYTDAEALYRDALQVCIATFGRQHRETATCLDNLATNLRSQSRFQEAMIHGSEALEIRRNVLGDDHVHTAASYCNTGYLYRLLGRYEESLEMLVKSLQIRERHKGPDHPLVAESLDRIASVYRDTGKFDEALPLCERALTIRTTSLGSDHPLTAASKNNKALILERRKDDTAFESSLLPMKSPSLAAAPAPVPKARARAPRETHSAGYAILGMVFVGLIAAAILFSYVPWIGALLILAVAAASLVMRLSSIRFESIIRRMAGKVLNRKNDHDRDSVALGRRVGPGTEIKPAARSSILTAEAVREFPPKAASDVLDLWWVKSMTPAAAEALAHMPCGLQLNALEDLPSKLAKAIRTHRGSLELNGVKALTVPAAMAIAKHSGSSLMLNGLSECPGSIAGQLAVHRGTLSLDGLRSIDENAAAALVKHGGAVSLMGLQLVSRQTVAILRKSPRTLLPATLGEGI